MSDDEFNRLLDDFPRQLNLHLTWTKYFQKLVNVGRRTGLTDIRIGDLIRQKYEGQLPAVTIRKALPASFKHQEMTREPHSNNKFAIKNIANQARLVTPEEPKIPPSPQVVKEIEPVPEIIQEPKPVTNEPSTNLEIESKPVQMGSIIATLDLNQFEQRIRTAFMSREKTLKLKINNNVVTAIL